jgi:hypothetical protein
MSELCEAQSETPVSLPIFGLRIESEPLADSNQVGESIAVVRIETALSKKRPKKDFTYPATKTSNNQTTKETVICG